MSLSNQLSKVSTGRRSLINIGLILGVFVVMIAIMAISGDLWRIPHALKHAHPGWLVAAGLCVIVYLVVEGLTLVISTRILNLKLKTKDLVAIALLGHLFTNLTPFASGGQPAQAWALINKGAKPSLASSALLARLFLYQLALTLVAASLIYLRFDYFTQHFGGFSAIALTAFLIHFAVLLVLICIPFAPTLIRRSAHALLRLAGRFFRIKRKRLAHYGHRIDTEITLFKQSFKRLRYAKGEIVVLFVVSVVQLIFLYAVPYCIIRALGVSDIDFLTSLAATAFVTLIATAAPVPGGAGGAEGCFALFFSEIIPVSGVTGIALLLWRITTYYLPILIETPCLKVVGKPPAVSHKEP